MKNKVKTNEEVVNNNNQPQQIDEFGGEKLYKPSEQWLNDYMKRSFEMGVISSIEESIHNTLSRFRVETIDCLDDSLFHSNNFPYIEKEEIIETYDEVYMNKEKSQFIKNLRKFLLNESKKLLKLKNEWNENERLFDEYVSNI